MRHLTFPMSLFLVVSVSIFVTSCARPASTRLLSPGAGTFRQEPKPVPPIAILTHDSAELARQHQRDKDEWGAEGWNRLNDVRLWFGDQGVTGLPCIANARDINPRKYDEN